MQLIKKILLALIFTFSFSFVIFYFIGSVLNTIKPVWFQGDEGNGEIFWWVFFGIFLLSSLSSILWLTNKINKFWFLKIPALFILPFSIPFLILDYLEPKNKTVIIVKNKKIGQKTEQLMFLQIIVIINYLTAAAQSAIIIGAAIAWSNWYWFWMFAPLVISCGSMFLILDYFHPNYFLRGLSYLGLSFNWFYLFFNLIEKKKIDYFFKTAKNPNNEQI